MRRSARPCSKPAQAVADPSAGASRPSRTASCCWRMEDVLEVSTRPYDPRRPQVCLDETSRQLLGEINPPRPLAPGRPGRQDYEYQRGGVCNLFLVAEPLAGWRDVMVSARRTRIDWAHSHQGPGRCPLSGCRADRAGPGQPRAPTRRRRCMRRSRRPRPGGWPTGWSCTPPPSTAAGCSMAEIELAMLAGQCLDRRLADQPTLEREAAGWQAARNRAGRGVNWRFTTEDARIKLKHLYPTTQR
jgi:hypothetical protein